ncbi:hypothetical protein BDB00DRAFT_800530 [Zychaea mexicana]|uniref:uncharacterized protein n=1 Tax=Zychaea mexicana TaxID=64656 RepID=UPI0022FE6287|nr:uncharacterized protein BDB00DRAFT_800530 [Zychaea mexicana]KAI9498495.1 hypothetical protein BDB00DRAFT_800530 [Zychaea mexicana]
MESTDSNAGRPASPPQKGTDNVIHKSNGKEQQIGVAPSGGGSSSVGPSVSTATSIQQGSDARSTSETATAINNNSNSTTTAASGQVTFTAPPATTSEATVAAVTAAAAADESALQNQKLVEEFQYLLEKSQSLFSGLRDLPPTGSHRQWRPYFEKTFEVYTKLWKFQQTHRPVLEDKNNYGLKRWEVGEIASKIGQLYYHYYLRTSDTSYLQEAFVFYDAIHERQYFKDILEVKNPALMIKKMRYYARFVVVSLLLNKDSNIRLLISELESLVDEYTKSFKPPDAKEWQIVLDEINTFMEAEKKLAPVSADRTPVTVEHRLSWSSGLNRGDGVGAASNSKLKLQEAILVGNCQKQIKFSELTLDMYRILQSLEMQPPGTTTTNQTSTTATKANKGAASKPATATTLTTDQASAHHDGKDPVMSKDKSTTTRSIVGVHAGTAGDDSTGGGSAANNTSSTVSGDQQQKQSQQTPEQSQTTQEQQQVQPHQSSQQQQTQNSQQRDQQQQQQGNNNLIGGDKGTTTISRRINPHKYLLYRPSLSQLFVYISTAFKDTADNGAMLLYLSADGCEYPEAQDPGYRSGVATNNRKTQQQNVSAASGITAERSDSTPAAAAAGGGSTSTSAPGASNTAPGSSPFTAAQTASPPIVPSVYCLHPADLIPFTRKPLFLIVDSSSSVAFSSIPNVFDQPVMSLMSPTEYPSSVQDRSEIGSLFTLFLHTPLLGFCSVSDIGNLDQSNWDECVSLISAMEQKIGETLLAHPDVDAHVKRFMTDEFLWTFVVRFTLCCIILRCHSSFKDEKTFPSCHPPLPDNIYSSLDIIGMLRSLTDVADVATYFNFPFVNEEPVES